MAKWKVGDVVRLKSGGPMMTVNIADADGQSCHCEWFVNGEAQRGYYNMESLEKATPPSSIPK
jgi:uncharacterized protein YodC (DUF2158 family)